MVQLQEPRQLKPTEIDTVSVEPGSPTNTNFSMDVATPSRKNQIMDQISSRVVKMDSDMTSSVIIELLEPSVRDSLNKRKMSMNTDLLKSGGIMVLLFII